MTEQGIIVKGLGGLYTVAFQGEMYACPARGIFRKDGFKPMIGDRVVLSEINESTKDAVIEEILPRKNQLVRPAVANVDQIVIVMAAKSPAPDLLLIDKLLISAMGKNVPVVMVINKTDQSSELSQEWKAQYKNAVSEILMCCAKDGVGGQELRELLNGKISVMAGQSGAGKSTLLNLLLGDTVMETGGLSKKTDRGRHTTRHNEMFMLDGSFIIDSPGFSLFEMEELEPLELQNMYPELNKEHGSCFFPDCSHTGEPKCFVTELLETGAFHKERYERYKLLYKELKEREKNKYK